MNLNVTLSFLFKVHLNENEGATDDTGDLEKVIKLDKRNVMEVNIK